MKKWEKLTKFTVRSSQFEVGKIINLILTNRGIKSAKEKKLFLTPPNPEKLTAKNVEIDVKSLKQAIIRIKKAIKNKESIVVYADYDADGITGGAVMWETIHKLGGNVMPYIPHRVEEGYGLSVKGINSIIIKYKPKLIITVDHGITAREKVEYAKKKGIEVIITDHHVKPKKIPKCLIVHTTNLSGSGVSYFLAKEIIKSYKIIPERSRRVIDIDELLVLATIGTIADLVPLTSSNRSIVKMGLEKLNQTKRVGLLALIKDSGLEVGTINTYSVSHILAPRLNAMGRLVHGLDALRLLCTKNSEAAQKLAKKLGLTNRERQQLTIDTFEHVKQLLPKTLKKLIFVTHETYNQGVIGLVAGKLTESFYRPAIVVSKSDVYSKASARSINGLNIIETIRQCSELLVDAGGHPMAAGFTVETAKITLLQKKLEELVEQKLPDEKLQRLLKIDLEIPLSFINLKLWQNIQQLAPFGMGNWEPVFMTKNIKVLDSRLIGRDKQHLKLLLQSNNVPARQELLLQANAGGTMKQFNNSISFEAIGFNMGEYYSQLKPDKSIDVAYSIDLNEWNGSKKLQLKLKDIHI